MTNYRYWYNYGPAFAYWWLANFCKE